MDKEEKLYEVLGELLYAVAKADGVVQPEEKKALQDLLKDHKSGSNILWSFEYEHNKGATVKDLYNKVISYCHSYGASPVYQEFINAMTIIAESAEGVQKVESDIIASFSNDLIERFQRDADRLMPNEDEIR